MKPFDERTNYDEDLQSMKKKIQLSDKEHLTIFHQLNKKMEQESAKRTTFSKKKYYFSFTLAFIILGILILPTSIPLINQWSAPNGSSLEQGVKPSDENKTTNSVDEGHHQLDQIRNKLQDLGNTLEEREHIGYTHSIDQLFQYLLAIHFGDKSLLDEGYSYQHKFTSIEELVSSYQNYVDFSRLELNTMAHEGSEIEIILNYINKETGNVDFLQFHLDYRLHQLTDLTSFEQLSSKTAFLEEIHIVGEMIQLHMTYVEKVDDDSAPNGFRIEVSEEGIITLPLSTEVPFHMLEDDVSLLKKVNWTEVTEFLPAYIQLHENENGEVVYIKEFYLP
ncbi:MAG: hypothetical protein ACK4M9_19630 [Anaerobacillus sp.]|uniref:hypothetical protein n=1 Tax=Anaerobacillus sp. TaxID=1872506 RepID=UPI00391C5155